MSKGLEALEDIKYKLRELEFVLRHNNQEKVPYIQETKWYIIEKELKALEIIKENLVVSYDENKNDKPYLMLGVKVNKDNLVVIYETYDKEKIDLLKEVLNEHAS